MIMRELLLIDLAICAAVIVVAAAVMLWRRGSGRPPVIFQDRPGSVAELADEGLSGREVAGMPGFGPDIAERDLGAKTPAGPQQAAESELGGAAAADLRSDGLGPQPDEPPAAAAAVTFSQRIISYYEQADQPVAGYLAARGWTAEQRTPGPAAGDAAPASPKATAQPDTARRRLAA